MTGTTVRPAYAALNCVGAEPEVPERAERGVGERLHGAGRPGDPGQRQALGVDQLDRAGGVGGLRHRVGQAQGQRAVRLVEAVDAGDRAHGEQLEVVELHGRGAVLRNGRGHGGNPASTLA